MASKVTPRGDDDTMQIAAARKELRARRAWRKHARPGPEGGAALPEAPAAIFDALLRDGRVPPSWQLIGPPGARPLLPIRPGDVAILRALGEGRLATTGAIAAVREGSCQVRRPSTSAETRVLAKARVASWALLEAGRLREDVAVLRLSEAADDDGCGAPTEPPEPARADLPAAAPLPRRPSPQPSDDTTTDPAIRFKDAYPRNWQWWHTLDLDEAPPLRGLAPDTQPRAYANRTLVLQRYMVKQALDQRVLQQRIEPDGILGPRTVRILWALATDPALSSFGTDFSALGVDLEGLAARGHAAARGALAATTPPQVIAEWTLHAPGDRLVDLLAPRPYRGRSLQRLDEFVVQGISPAPDLGNWPDRIALLRAFFGARELRARAALLRYDRPFSHLVDAVALTERHQGKRREFFVWMDLRARTKDGGLLLDEVEAKLSLGVPRVPGARGALEELRAGQGGVRLLVAFYLPRLPVSERARALAAWEAERQTRELQRRAANREQLAPLVDDAVELLKGSRRDIVWELRLERTLRALRVQPAEAAEQFLDLLQAREGGRWFEALFDGVAQIPNLSRRALLVDLARPTTHGRSPAFQRLVTAHQRAADRVRSHRIDPVAKTILLDKNATLVVRPHAVDPARSIAGAVYQKYLLDDSRDRIQPARLQALCKQTLTELQALVARVFAAGDDDAAGRTQTDFNALVKEAIDQALKNLRPALTEQDIERVDWELSVRVHDLRPVERDGLPSADVHYERVQRFAGGPWEAIPDTLAWRSDGEFADELALLAVSQVTDAIEVIGLVAVGAAAVLLAWQTGLAMALVRAAGGTGPLLVSIGLNELIELISARRLTLEGVLTAALRGYLDAVGFRLFAPVGRLAGRLLNPASNQLVRRAVGAWLVQRAITGGGGAAFGNLATLFATDLIRILREGGDLSSWQRYAVQGGLGLVFGAVCEIGGSVALAGIFHAVQGKTVLRKAADVAALLAQHKVSPQRWLAAATGALSRTRQWLAEILQAGKETGALTFLRQRLVEVTKELLAHFKAGARLSYHLDVLTLADLDLTPAGIDGLERLLVHGARQLRSDDVLAVIQALRSQPKRADALLGLIGAVDKEALPAILQPDVLVRLIGSDAVGVLFEHATVADVRFVFRRLGGSVEALERWAQAFAKLDADNLVIRESLLWALRNHGELLSPWAYLRKSEIPVLDESVIAGIQRLVHLGLRNEVEALAGSPTYELVELLGLIADPLLATDRVLSTFFRDPVAVQRTLRYVDNADDLHALMIATQGHTEILDAVLPTMTPLSGGLPMSLDDAEMLGLVHLLRLTWLSLQSHVLLESLRGIVKLPGRRAALLRWVGALSEDDALMLAETADWDLARVDRHIALLEPAVTRKHPLEALEVTGLYSLLEWGNREGRTLTLKVLSDRANARTALRAVARVKDPEIHTAVWGTGFYPIHPKTQSKHPFYQGEERGKVASLPFRITYLTPEERVTYRLSVHDGRLYNARGEPLQTVRKGSRAVFQLFVMDSMGELYAGDSVYGKFHHSSFLAGAPVAAAGELAVDKGILMAILLRSSHYPMSKTHLDQLLRELQNRGVPLSGVSIQMSSK